MKKRYSGNIKRKIALAAVIIGIILSFLTFFFVRGVKKQLWEQSISTIRESTQQGLNTLEVQLRNEYDSMSTMTGYLKKFSKTEKGKLREALESYARADKACISPTGAVFPQKQNRMRTYKKCWIRRQKETVSLNLISAV